MSAKHFFQETLGTNKKECLQAPVALDISKGVSLTIWGVYAAGCYCCDFKIELSDAM